MRGIQEGDDSGDVVCGGGAGVADGGVVGVEEFPEGVDVVGDVEVLDGEFLALEGGPAGRGAGRAGNADAVVVAEFDDAEEALGEGLAGGAFGAVAGPPLSDVLVDVELVPACRVDGVGTCDECKPLRNSSA